MEAAKFLLQNNIEIPLVVCPESGHDADAFRALGKESGIAILSDDKILYKMIQDGDERTKNIELVVSYLYWRRIKMPLIKLGAVGCVNFHPAPLPDYKSRAGYNTAILDGQKEFGVSAHFIDSEEFDSGPIIKVARFEMPATGHVLDLVDEAQKKLLELFKEVIELFQSGMELELASNNGGLYLNGAELENLKLIDPERDSKEEIKKKIRAFFYPPYHGATIDIKGEKYTILDEESLRFLAKKLGIIS